MVVFKWSFLSGLSLASYYPKDGASYSYPEKRYDGERVYYCASNWPGINFKFDKKVTLQTCVDAAMTAYASYNGPIKLVDCEVTQNGDPKYDEHQIFCQSLNGWPIGKKQIMKAHSYSTTPYMSCPNSNQPANTIGFPTDDAPEKCYHPDDMLLGAQPSDKSCKSAKNTFSLRTKEANAIKSAASLAKKSLERMEADLAAPNEINSGKLNQIASLFGIENYQDPQFAILTTAIQSGSIGCVKNKLEAASLDPSGNGYLSFEDSNGGVSGVHCKDKNGDDIIQVHVKDISHFHPVYANQAMQELLVHETLHGCNDVHPLNMHYMEKSEIRSKFDTQVQSYKNLVGSGNELDILKRLIKNPYYFEYLLKVYL